MSSDLPSSPVSGWSGRVDGTAPEHLRWHQAVRPADDNAATTDDAPGRSTALVGFASDEGVRRNHGRVGASEGPAALRAALSSLAVLEGTGALVDAGDVVVEMGSEDAPGDLEGGQEELAGRIAGLLDAHTLTVVLGGGHETAYASATGLVRSGRVAAGTRVGILNLDAHFDLREAPRPSSGTPFLQALRDADAAEHEIAYAIVGISEANNTRVLFDTARERGVTWLTDEQSQTADVTGVRRFVRAFIDAVDVLYLTIDLDVLPAAVAPGVSAPAGFGVPYEVIHACAAEATESGKLALADVVELNPSLDVDGRTAKSAARLIHTIVSRHRRG
ncbi:formimidoylglutamase [Micrococcus flavus]|uniref:Formimidoylglutamase n=1 Tax=Micrococcus flavus TaxID=384602 RepID=A0A4Y8X346_9MICC|nr:formimidoylglutamase [Micrococcus flavus]MBB4883615.1 formiminoglutamase [Micrococcus flavus]TFI02447.1 formimidoylglutamase [Micrococcus flavus]GGK53023.1 formimidoylglutamase [Micrococcus flavus]